jgi:sarcosine oxidase gamma subunit
VTNARLTRSIEEATLARQLAAYGRRTESAIALIAAAEILQRHTPIRVEGDTASSVLLLLREAKTFGPSPELAVLIEQMIVVSGFRTRGATDGPRTSVNRVAALVTNRHSMSFRENQPAVVHVEGDGSSALEVRVFGQGGNLIGQSAGSGSQTVRWTPPRTETVRIEVRNRGSAPNEYLIVSN